MSHQNLVVVFSSSLKNKMKDLATIGQALLGIGKPACVTLAPSGGARVLSSFSETHLIPFLNLCYLSGPCIYWGGLFFIKY